MCGLNGRRTNSFGKALIALFVFIFLPALVHAQVTVASPLTTDYVGFSTGDGALRVVIEAIQSAQKTIRVACYEFTSREIARAFLDAARNGVDVEIVADRRASEQRYSEVRYLARDGIQVRLDGHYAIMHNKFMVIDDISIETGSFNYTSTNGNNCRPSSEMVTVPPFYFPTRHHRLDDSKEKDVWLL